MTLALLFAPHVLPGNRKVLGEEEDELTLFREAKIEDARGTKWVKQNLSSYKSELSYGIQREATS